MLMAFSGTAVNTLLAVIVLVGGGYPLWLGIVMVVSAMISWLGIITTSAGSGRLGGWLVMAGAVTFVPIGFLAFMGGTRILDAEKRRQRKLASRRMRRRLTPVVTA